MTEHEIPAENITAKRFQLILEYIRLQEMLVAKAVAKFNPEVTEYDFKECLAATTTLNGVEWTARAHGLGVMFTNPESNVVVDVHVGFVDAPAAFDAWRLVQYCESRFGTSEELNSWQLTLDKLVHDGTLEPHGKYERHYLAKKGTRVQ